jgi:PAS domain-containing protein
MRAVQIVTTRPWRFMAGPLVTLATVAFIACADRYWLSVPNPGAISFVAIVWATYFGGTLSGLLAGAISIAYAAYYFSVPGELLHFRSDHLARILILIIATPAVVFMVGALQFRTEESLRKERAARRAVEEAYVDLRRLHAALDQADDGVVLLDEELRAQFINRAFRRMWKLSEEQAKSRPPFIALMYHGRQAKAYAVAEGEVDAYVAKRTALVRAGDETPTDLRLADGQVIRFKCKVLPGGGRMLSYVYVTDLVRHADELKTVHAALDEIDYGVILLNRDMRIEFINRAARDLGGVPAFARVKNRSIAN